MAAARVAVGIGLLLMSMDVGTLCVALSAQCFGIGAALTKYVDVHALLFDAVRAPLLWVTCAASVLVAWRLAGGRFRSKSLLQVSLLQGVGSSTLLTDRMLGSAEDRLLLFGRGLAYWCVCRPQLPPRAVRSTPCLSADCAGRLSFSGSVP